MLLRAFHAILGNIPVSALAVRAHRFTFEAIDRVRLDAPRFTNFFRGALGNLLFHSTCLRAGACDVCLEPDRCVFGRVFAPHAPGGPSGFADPPRPFVLRLPAGEPAGLVDRGCHFSLDLHRFDTGDATSDEIALCLRGLSIQGVGPGRGRVQLVRETDSVVSMPLTGQGSGSLDRIRLAFTTPTEMKYGGRILREPYFPAVFSRCRDRISALMRYYQGGAPALDFERLGNLAQNVRLIRQEVIPAEVTRRSSRTGDSHSTGGFTGFAEYEGVDVELIPLLAAAWWTGIGRHTVWGNGAVRLTVEP